MSDYIVRATAANAQIRAFAVYSKEIVEKAREAHNLSPVATAALGRLMSGGVMMGAMLKGEKDLLTLQVNCDGPIGGITLQLLSSVIHRFLYKFHYSSTILREFRIRLLPLHLTQGYDLHLLQKKYAVQ